MTELGYSLASMVVRRLPRRASDAFVHAISDCYVFTHPRRALAVDRNLAWIWSDSGCAGAPPRARETYRAFARAVRDFLAPGPGSSEPTVRLSASARQALEEARRSPRGAVLVSAHFGPWERALQWLAGELGGVEALAARHRLAAVDRFFVRQRERGGVRTLCSTRPVSSALRSLKSGGWIAALADRPRHDRFRGRGIVPIDRGPLLLARRAEALVLPGVSTFAADGALEIDFDAPFALGSGRHGIDVPQGIARLQRFFDGHVRAHPTQWFEWGATPGSGVPAPGA